MKIARTACLIVALWAMACSNGGGGNGAPCCYVANAGNGVALGSQCGCPVTTDSGVSVTVETSGGACTLVFSVSRNGSTNTATYSGGVPVASCSADGG